jgi:hypothetical protein
MLHIERTTDGGFMVVDAGGGENREAAWADTASAGTEDQLRTLLKTKYKIIDKAIDKAILDLKNASTAMISLG